MNGRFTAKWILGVLVSVLGTVGAQASEKAPTPNGAVGCMVDLSIPCWVENENGETFGLRLSLLPTDYYSTHYGLEANLLAGYGYRERLVGVGIGTVGYWSLRAQGVTMALFNAGVEMEGLQLGFLNGFSPYPYKRSLLTDLRGAQLGCFNVAGRAWAQFGLINFKVQEGGLQVGLWNTTRWKVEGSVQIGLINVVKTSEHPKGGYLQLGLLNGTRSGWWLPISNFGL